MHHTLPLLGPSGGNVHDTAKGIYYSPRLQHTRYLLHMQLSADPSFISGPGDRDSCGRTGDERGIQSVWVHSHIG